MRFDLDITIDKGRIKPNAFLLRWDPAHSSYSIEQLDREMNDGARGAWSNTVSRPIRDWEQAGRGDRFFLLRTGEGQTGLFAAGRFASECYLEEGKHRVLLEFETIIHPDRAEIIPTAELARDLPHCDWQSEESGILLDRETAERLELIWRDYIGLNKQLYLPRAVRNDHYDTRSEIDKAIALASKAHAADYDLDGNPTILHPLAVGMMGKSDTERVVGFLHDVVEDTAYDFDDLADEGFSREVIEALRLLTHDKQTPYMGYIERICRSGNDVALRVKLNDLTHNIARGLAGGHMRCVEKHRAALARIFELRPELVA